MCCYSHCFRSSFRFSVSSAREVFFWHYFRLFVDLLSSSRLSWFATAVAVYLCLEAHFDWPLLHSMFWIDCRAFYHGILAFSRFSRRFKLCNFPLVRSSSLTISVITRLYHSSSRLFSTWQLFFCSFVDDNNNEASMLPMWSRLRLLHKNIERVPGNHFDSVQGDF